MSNENFESGARDRYNVVIVAAMALIVAAMMCAEYAAHRSAKFSPWTVKQGEIIRSAHHSPLPPYIPGNIA